MIKSVEIQIKCRKTDDPHKEKGMGVYDMKILPMQHLQRASYHNKVEWERCMYLAKQIRWGGFSLDKWYLCVVLVWPILNHVRGHQPLMAQANWKIGSPTLLEGFHQTKSTTPFVFPPTILLWDLETTFEVEVVGGYWKSSLEFMRNVEVTIRINVLSACSISQPSHKSTTRKLKTLFKKDRLWFARIWEDSELFGPVWRLIF